MARCRRVHASIWVCDRRHLISIAQLLEDTDHLGVFLACPALHINPRQSKPGDHLARHHTLSRSNMEHLRITLPGVWATGQVYSIHRHCFWALSHELNWTTIQINGSQALQKPRPFRLSARHVSTTDAGRPWPTIIIPDMWSLRYADGRGDPLDQ